MQNFNEIPAQEFRKEIKFAYADYFYQEVKHWIRLNPQHFTKAFPDRYVNSIYFDSINFSNFEDNMVGIGNRIKPRIRWYGDLLGKVSRPQLEFKIKKNNCGTKVRFDLAPLDMQKGISYQEIASILEQSKLPRYIFEIISTQRPNMIVRYHREYFGTPLKTVMVTIDRKLEYFKLNSLCNNFLETQKNDPRLIVEIKCDVNKSEKLGQTIRHFPMRILKNSKYVTGVEALY